LLGRQIGVYLSAVRAIGDLRRAEEEAQQKVRELQILQEEQRRMFEDLSHQLKGPLRLAKRRLELSFSHVRTPADVERDLMALRGLIRKADRVTKSMRVLAELGKGRMLSTERSPLESSRLIRILIEAAQDTQLHLADNRHVRFRVDRESLFGRNYAKVLVDYDLLDQAISNLLDNAAKYSYANTEVAVFGSLTGRGRFQISVANQGLVIKSQHIRQCVERGWRSDEATWTTGEGAGIGLWIVDNIMKAHGGQLVIEPTDRNGITVVKLVFPLPE
jgi:signal transduction histidine kinase